MINILLSSFRGLNLPSTLTLPICPETPLSELYAIIVSRLPESHDQYIIKTTSNKRILLSSDLNVRSLLTHPDDAIVPLRLTVPLYGGKGGFGSQLRAAGGRMSSKRKRNQGENNGSNRNLDGRRLRTVTEAKALAEYLSIKPGMDAKDKEARRKRWEKVVDIAEQKEFDLKHQSKAKTDGKWMEEKEEAEERTRDAVLAAIETGNYKDNLSGMGDHSSLDRVVEPDQVLVNDATELLRINERLNTSLLDPISNLESKSPHVRTYYGFDEDYQFMSEDEEQSEGEKRL